MSIAELRAYGIPNLIQAATSVSIDAPENIGGSEAAADVLISSESSGTIARRACSTSIDAMPFNDAVGGNTGKLCYRTKESKLASGQFKLTLTFDQEYFQHAILLVESS